MGKINEPTTKIHIKNFFLKRENLESVWHQSLKREKKPSEATVAMTAAECAGPVHSPELHPEEQLDLRPWSSASNCPGPTPTSSFPRSASLPHGPPQQVGHQVTTPESQMAPCLTPAPWPPSLGQSLPPPEPIWNLYLSSPLSLTTASISVQPPHLDSQQLPDRFQA